MIDVMLVLLIIFMIVTPLIANGFKAVMPQGKNLTPDGEDDGEVVLGIDESGKYFLNGGPDPERGAPGSVEERLCGADHGQDHVLPCRLEAQVLEDPGSGRNRAPGRSSRPGGRHRKSSRPRVACFATEKEK
jgi:hypothetical protein